MSQTTTANEVEAVETSENVEMIQLEEAIGKSKSLV